MFASHERRSAIAQGVLHDHETIEEEIAFGPRSRQLRRFGLRRQCKSAHQIQDRF